MGQALLDYSAPPQTALDRVEQLFRSRPNQFISALEIATVGGWLSSRTRISECRTQLGMRIDNKTEMVNGSKHSFYRFTP
jgi:hypothetical protein